MLVANLPYKLFKSNFAICLLPLFPSIVAVFFTSIQWSIYSLKIPDDDSHEYSSPNGLLLYNDDTVLKITPTHDATLTINYTGDNLVIKDSSGSNKRITKQSSPYELKVTKGKIYYLSGYDDKPITISNIEYTLTTEGAYVGSFKGSNKFTVKPSYMKRVICEGPGTAKIYVLSPKGQALINITMHIE